MVADIHHLMILLEQENLAEVVVRVHVVRMIILEIIEVAHPQTRL